MSTYPEIQNEEDRIAALHSYNILDTLTEADFDDLTELASIICGVPISLISLVDRDRQWFKSHKGLSISETDRTQSFCAHAIAKPKEILIVEDAHQDERFKDNPLVTGDLHLTFYAGVPLTDRDGFPLGSLCVIDREARKLSDTQLKALEIISRQVIDKLELRREHAKLQEAEQTNEQLREKLNVTLTELGESEENMRLAAEAANLGLWIVNIDTLSLTASDNYKAQMGFAPTDQISMESVYGIMDPAYVQAVNKAVREGIEQKKNPVIEYPIKHKVTGERRWIRGVGKLETDNDGKPVRLIGMNMDITEQKERTRKVENLNEELINLNSQVHLANEELENAYEELSLTNEELQTSIKDLKQANEQLEIGQAELEEANSNLYQSEEKLRLAIESSRLGTWYINTKTKEFDPSPRLKELFGYHPDEVMPYDAAMLQIRKDYSEKVKEAVEVAVAAFGMYDIEYPIIGYHDKAVRWVRATGKIYKGRDGKDSIFFGTMDDITERKQNELRKNDFINIVSHEMKTPITVLSGYLQVIKLVVPADDTTIDDLLNKALVQVKRVTNTINDFLNTPEADGGQIKLNKQPFNMGQLLALTTDEFSAANPSYLLKYKGCDAMDVMADRDKITNVVSNFLSNAVKYAPKGKTIYIDCETGKTGVVTVKVTDEGRGIALEDQTKLFTRYSRIRNAENENIAGHGIGLYLSAEIIAAHGGRIGVESEEGRGSTFWFTLPG